MKNGSVKVATTTAMSKVFIDDVRVHSKNSEDIDIAKKNHWTFYLCHVARTKLEKLKFWNPTETMLQSVRILHLNEEYLDVVSKLKSLDIQVRCVRRMINDVAEEQVRKDITVSRRKSELDCAFGWIDGHVRIPCGTLHSQTNRSTVGHETQKSLSRNRIDNIRQRTLIDPFHNIDYQSLR